MEGKFFRLVRQKMIWVIGIVLVAASIGPASRRVSSSWRRRSFRWRRRQKT